MTSKSQHGRRPTLALALALAALLPVLSGCGEHAPGTGSIAFNARFAGEPIGDGQTSSGAARMILPAAVINIGITIGGIDIVPIQATYPVGVGSATIGNVPVGNNRTILLEGLDSGGGVLYQALTTGITVNSGQTTTPPTIVLGPVFTAVEANATGSARGFSVALALNGTVWTWGNNERGQLGNGLTNQVSTSVPGLVCAVGATAPCGSANALSGIVEIAVGAGHVLARRSDGALFAWGRNGNLQVNGLAGTDTCILEACQATPVLVEPASSVSAVAAGGRHSLAVYSGGEVFAWGNNNVGQIGNSTTGGDWPKTQVCTDPACGSFILANAVAVGAGGSSSYARMADGSVRAWGNNGGGQLGINFDSTTTTQVPVASAPVCAGGTIDAPCSTPLGNVAKVVGGDLHAAAITSGGAPWIWGDNTNGELGFDTLAQMCGSQPCTPLATPLTGLPVNTVDIATGGAHTLAAFANGSVYSAGSSTYGQRGILGSIPLTPTQVCGPIPGGNPCVNFLDNIVDVAAGPDHSLALDSSGRVWAWGRNEYGQLGRASAPATCSTVNCATTPLPVQFQ